MSVFFIFRQITKEVLIYIYKSINMVREVITVSVGQAGVQLGQNVWQEYCFEHRKF